jgi:beta-lactamase class D
MSVQQGQDPIFTEFGVTGSFMLCEVNSDSCLYLNAARCGERFIPASTFKVLNSMIALETRVIEGTEEVLKWNGHRYSVEVWNQDQDMEHAFQRSCVWFYQELARRIGETRMREYLQNTAYGNMDIGGGIDRFWLDGDLRISQKEQLVMLRKLWKEELPFRPEVQQTVKRLMILEKTDSYTFYGKTGLADINSVACGWLVGFLERDDRVYCYALNIEGPDASDSAFRKARYSITRRLLERYDLMP